MASAYHEGLTFIGFSDHARRAQSTDVLSKPNVATVVTAIDTVLPSGSADDLDHGSSYHLKLALAYHGGLTFGGS